MPRSCQGALISTVFPQQRQQQDYPRLQQLPDSISVSFRIWTTHSHLPQIHLPHTSIFISLALLFCLLFLFADTRALPPVLSLTSIYKMKNRAYVMRNLGRPTLSEAQGCLNIFGRLFRNLINITPWSEWVWVLVIPHWLCSLGSNTPLEYYFPYLLSKGMNPTLSQTLSHSYM